MNTNDRVEKLHIYVPGFTYQSLGPLFIDKLIISASGAYTSLIEFEGPTEVELFKTGIEQGASKVFEDHCKKHGNAYNHVICSREYAGNSVFADLEEGNGKTTTQDGAENPGNILCEFTILNQMNVDIRFDIQLYSKINNVYVYVDTYSYIYNPLITKANMVATNLQSLEVDLDRFVLMDRQEVDFIQFPIYEFCQYPVVDGTTKYVYNPQSFQYTGTAYTFDSAQCDTFSDKVVSPTVRINGGTFLTPPTWFNDTNPNIETYKELINKFNEISFKTVIYPLDKYWSDSDKRAAIRGYNNQTQAAVLASVVQLGGVDENSSLYKSAFPKEWTIDSSYFRFLPEELVEMSSKEDAVGTVEDFTAIGCTVYNLPKFIVNASWKKTGELPHTIYLYDQKTEVFDGYSYFSGEGFPELVIEPGYKEESFKINSSINYNVEWSNEVRPFHSETKLYDKDDSSNIFALEVGEDELYFKNLLMNKNITPEVVASDVIVKQNNHSITFTRDYDIQVSDMKVLVHRNRNLFDYKDIQVEFENKLHIYTQYDQSNIPTIPNNMVQTISRGFVFNVSDDSKVGHHIKGDIGGLQKATAFSNVCVLSDKSYPVDQKMCSSFNSNTYNKLTAGMSQNYSSIDFNKLSLSEGQTKGVYVIKFDYFNLESHQQSVPFELELIVDGHKYAATTNTAVWVFKSNVEWSTLQIKVTNKSDSSHAVLISDVVIGKISDIEIPLESSLQAVQQGQKIDDVYLMSYICPFEHAQLNLNNVVVRDYNSCLFGEQIAQMGDVYHIGRTIGYYQINGLDKAPVITNETNIISYCMSSALFNSSIKPLLYTLSYAD